MKMRGKKIISFMLVLMLCITGLAVPQDVSAKTTKKYVTRADVVAAVNEILGATETTTAIEDVKDVKETDSYYEDMSIALNAGLIKVNDAGKLLPNKKATYKYVSTVLARALGSSQSTILGEKDGSAYLTKSQLKKFLKSKVPNVVTKSKKKVKTGNVVVNTSGVTLKNLTVQGNLVIGDGVGDGEVTLNNVTVTGKMMVRGGGENSVIIKGASSVSKIVVRQANNNVSLKIQGDANVSVIYVNDGSNDVNIVGNVGSVTVRGSDLMVSLISATVGSVTVESQTKNVTILTDADSAVETMTLNAEGTTVSGEGKISVIKVNAENTVIDVACDSVETKDGIENVIITDDSDSNADTSVDTETGDNSNNSNNDSSGGGSNTSTSTDTGNSSDNSGNTSEDDSSDNSGETSEDGSSDTGEDTSGGDSSDTDISEATDDRFEDGYPLITLNQSTNSLTVTYKLKEGVASEENPAEIYNVVSYYNTSFETNTEAVLHGHLGTVTEDNHGLIQAGEAGYLKITDADEHTYVARFYEEYEDVTDGVVVYSVIKTSEYVSESPVKAYFDQDTVESTLSAAKPRVSGVYYNETRDKVYLYFYGTLDTTKVPDCGNFSVVSDEEESIEPSEVLVTNPDMTYTWGCVELSFANALSSEKEYYISYTQPEDETKALANTANIPAQAESFSNRQIESLDYAITNVWYSADDTYISFTLSGLGDQLSSDSIPESLVISVDGIEIDWSKIMWGYSYDSSDFEIWDAVWTKNTSGTHTIQVSAVEGKTVKNLANMVFSETVTTTEGTRCEEILSIYGAEYSKSEKTLTLTLANNFETERYSFTDCGCCFTLEVDGVEYGIRCDARGNYVDFSDHAFKLVLSEASMEHIGIDTENVSSIRIKYTAPVVSYNDGCSNSALRDASGRPMQDIDYVDVTLVD